MGAGRPEPVAGAARTSRGPRALPLALIAALLSSLALRLFVLWRNFDGLVVPAYELYLPGNLARFASAGAGYPAIVDSFDNCGGNEIYAFLATPLFALAGPTYFVLKLVPLAVALGVVALAWRLLDRHVDRRAANLGALLLAVGPVTVFKYSLLAKGDHFGGLLPQLLALAAFLRVHTSARRGRALLLAGLAAGFAAFFFLGSLLFLALLAFAHLATVGPRAALRDAPRAAAGFALGIAPLFVFEALAGGRASGYLVWKLLRRGGPGPEGSPLDRLRELALEVLPRAGNFRALGPLPGAVGEALFLVALAGALAVLGLGLLRGLRCARAEAAARPAFLLTAAAALYFPAVVGVIALSGFEFDPQAPPSESGQYRYLIPTFAFGSLGIAIAASRLVARGGARRALGFGLAGSALAAQLFTLPLALDRSPAPGAGRRYAGHRIELYSRVVMRLPKADPETSAWNWEMAPILAYVADLPEALRARAAFGVGHNMAFEASSLPLAKLTRGLRVAAWAAEFPEALRPDVARGAGSQLRNLARRDPRRPQLRALLERLAADGEPLGPAVVEGLSLDFAFRRAVEVREDLDVSARVGELVPLAYHDAWWRGRGRQCGRLLARDIPHERAVVAGVLATVPADRREVFYAGLGRGLRDDWLGGGEPPALERDVPERWRAAARATFAAP